MIEIRDALGGALGTTRPMLLGQYLGKDVECDVMVIVGETSMTINGIEDADNAHVMCRNT